MAGSGETRNTVEKLVSAFNALDFTIISTENSVLIRKLRDGLRRRETFHRATSAGTVGSGKV